MKPIKPQQAAMNMRVALMRHAIKSPRALFESAEDRLMKKMPTSRRVQYESIKKARGVNFSAREELDSITFGIHEHLKAKGKKGSKGKPTRKIPKVKGKIPWAASRSLPVPITPGDNHLSTRDQLDTIKFARGDYLIKAMAGKKVIGKKGVAQAIVGDAAGLQAATGVERTAEQFTQVRNQIAQQGRAQGLWGRPTAAPASAGMSPMDRIRAMGRKVFGRPAATPAVVTPTATPAGPVADYLNKSGITDASSRVNRVTDSLNKFNKPDRFGWTGGQKVGAGLGAVAATALIVDQLKRNRNREQFSARDRLNSIIEFVDTRPRNNLGEFQGDNEGPNPNNMAITYPVQRRSMGQDVAVGAGASAIGGGSMLGVKALIDKLRKSKR